MPAYTAPTWTNGSGTPTDATHWQAVSNALAQALQADGTGPILAALLQVAAGMGLVSSTASGDKIQFGLHGSTDMGLESYNHSVMLCSAIADYCKFNNYWDGTNDRFMLGASGTAYQLSIASSGIKCRKSTNTPVDDAVITWGVYTTLFS